ncbi:sugar ABC transporter substrate-binding protein [Phycicoccus endophyticus]|uniref:Sugar ABC transporter substrate-binding protein n=1 Tax=Phycicoccus endophyticus TaxID=1690220 RepID=A0A7G9R133_9MICO|nr:sugar ABC transporter substrate-binding protein [Phycicoccus endophyticus]NHI20563.1 sugar ABC transporter substrate-binding protein [Phycicoccus endophyticus]QNN49308.1 sugar ABC transporter substrate-binding protein [Phycicoccus endophyticus]GGL45064.1 solute-binding protein [Phycicoccus endophyticus]
MSTTRRHTILGATAAGGALLLTACGGGTGADQAGGGGDDAEKATTITLMAAEYSKDNTKAFWDAFADEYKSTYGYTLDVNVVSWDNIDQQSSTMIQNNQPPDILNLNAYASYAKDGLLYDSDEVLPDEAKSDILPTFVQYGTYDGKFYGFPDLASARALFYNTSLFSKAGIANPPTTWEELEADAQKITDGGDVGYAMPLGPEESQGEFSMWLFNNGGDWKTDGSWAINSEQNVETLTFMKKLADEGVTQANPARTNRADAFDLFASGKAGMVVGFSPLAASLDEDGTVDYAVAPFPSNDGTESKTFGVTDYLMAFKKSGNQDAVKAFYELYYSKDQINTFIEKEGFLPVTQSGLEYFQKDDKLKVYLDTLPNARLTPTDDPTWDKIKLAVQQNLGSAMTGDPQETLDKLQQTAESEG